MSEKHKQIHTAYCDYQIAKASKASRDYSVKADKTNKSIKTAGSSNAMLAKHLSMLIQKGE